MQRPPDVCVSDYAAYQYRWTESSTVVYQLAKLATMGRLVNESPSQSSGDPGVRSRPSHAGCL
eukprot:415320-Hanusia_phi.AAC.1